MADSMEHSEKNDETLVEKISDKFHHDDDSSSSSSDSDSDKQKEQQHTVHTSSSSVKDKFSRLFGTEKPVHQVFGGGKPADVFLWRNKKISAAVLGSATGVWVIFELLEYHLLTFVCHLLILAIAVLFLLSNVAAIFNKSPPRIPEVHLSEEPFLQVAAGLRFEINRGIAVLRDIASGRDLKRFLTVIAGLWFFSVIGSFCNFLTLFYIAFVLLHTVPVLYEKYEDKIDAFVEKASIEIKKQYAVFEDKVLSKIPRGPFKDKKRA